MNVKTERERLRIETGPAALAPNVVRFRPDPSPCPGDTFVLRETADFPVEWVIVERDLEDVRRLRVVPVDNYPQVGSHDIAVMVDEPGRVANIRCDLDTWLLASSFRPELRSGMLAPEELGHVRRKRDAIASGIVATSLIEEDVDSDPEYRRWKDGTLQDALGVLKKSVRPRRAIMSHPLANRMLALAASIMLVVSFWSRHEVRQLADQLVVEGQESEQAIETLHEDYRGLEKRSSQNAERHEREVAELRQGLDATQRELRAAQSDFSQANVPYSILAYDIQRSSIERRGDLELVEQTLELRQGASHVVLILEVVDAEPYDRYRLRILDDTTRKVVWSNDQLVRSGSVVSLSLPASVFELRHYRLVLYGIDGGKEPVQLKEGYLLNVQGAYGW